MKCHVCGTTMERIVTDLPFKISDTTIVIIKGLPVVQCARCPEYLLEDGVMARIDTILEKTDAMAELEIVRYAA